MRLHLSILTIFVTMLAAFVPAPASADIVDPCDNNTIERYCNSIPCRPITECCDISTDTCNIDCNLNVCDEGIPTIEPYVYEDGGRYVVGYSTCQTDYYGYTYCNDRDLAVVSTDTCDYASLCERPTIEPYVRNEGGQAYTVGYRTCQYDPYYGYTYCDDRDLYTVDATPCGSDVTCGVYAPQPYLRNNGDGTYTLGYTQCRNDPYYGYTCSSQDVRTVNADVCDYAPAACAVDDTCFAYNANALTNACITTSSGSQPVSHPSASVTSRRTCVIGQEGCADHAWVTPTTTTTYVPVAGADGYVELTAACNPGVPCRVTLP